MQRWPDLADSVSNSIGFHSRTEEVAPLRKYQPGQAMQGHVTQELFVRSLRSKALDMKTLGNNHWASPTVAETFSPRGLGDGWSGKTNTHWKPHAPTDSKDWFERPVATGKFSLDHNGGKRYVMDSRPRTCVPGSMSHAGGRGSSPTSPRFPASARAPRSAR
ncbi:unnamed protein product [Prorocentrum cordatum]|uniref:Phospholipase B-like n=1 Tax=Prorocentrum cordatum TaxID=2364126 RepID=A0ABN9PIY1_9DINO|nr:unnamed protein product [Polarella glacialis]